MKFAGRIALVGHYKAVDRYVHGAEAERLCKNGSAIIDLVRKRRVEQIRLVDYGLKHEDRYSTSSLQTIEVQDLRGSERLEIDMVRWSDRLQADVPRETRIVTTQPCNVYRLKHIRESDRDLYCMAVTDCLPKKSNVDFPRGTHSHGFGAA